jgi:hypothetical protein
LFGNLQNIWLSVKNFRDLIVAKGPEYLAEGAELATKVAGILTQISTYVSTFGPLVQFQPGQGDLSSDEAKKYVSDLATWKAEFDALATKAGKEWDDHVAMAQNELGVTQKGLLDRFQKMDPETKKFLLGLLSNWLGKVLIKTGMPAEQVFPAFSPKRANAAKK